MSVSSEFEICIDSVARPEWNRLLEQFDDATIQQTWDYGAVCWGEEQLSHFILKYKDAVVAMAQVRIVRVPVIGKGIAYLRWGPVCRRQGEPWNESTFRAAMAALQKEYCERRGLVLRILPNAFKADVCDAAIKQYLDETGFVLNPGIPAYRTMRVDLTQSEESLRKGLSQRWRSYLKKAENTADYVVREGNSDEFYAQFANAYDEMMNRKRFDTTVDIKEFGRIHSSLPEPLKLQILLCEQGGKLLNALVISPVGDSPVYLLAATSDAGLNGRGAFLLQWRAMLWLKQRGCKWYDLGGTDPNGNPGVYQFKSGMGGAEVMQRGAFDFSKDSLSSFCVAAGEKLQAFKHRLKKSPKPAAIESATPVTVEEK